MESLGDITTYRVQLEQVEAALVGEPENEELVKLKADLLDIIALTEDLMGLSGSKKQKVTEDDNTEVPPEEPEVQKKKKTGFTSLYDDDDNVTSSIPETATPNPDKAQVTITNNLGIGRSVAKASSAKVDIIDEKERLYRQQLQELKMMTTEWRPGEKCQALNHDSNQFNEAEVLCKGEGYLQVKYCDSGVIANVLLNDVRKNKKRRWGEPQATPQAVQEVKKIVLDKEKRKKKKQSKKQRQTAMEEAKEAEKKSWLSFMQGNKTINKTAAKKSIFASPDNFDGKIGIGTCGIAGKGMTNYTAPDKWKR